MIQNMNPNFNAIRLQTIMEFIQQMAPEGSPLVALAQQGAKVANVIIAQRSTGNPRGNHRSATDQTIGGREPEVRQQHQKAATTV
jgi:hypothetical protein